MNYYCGTDIIEVERIKNAILSTPGFKEKVFTPLEIEYADKKSDVTRFLHYAGRFAAKEAIYKSLSKIDDEVSLSDIEIINDSMNKNRPVVNILKPELNKLQQENKLIIDVSISHVKEYATANAISTLI